MSNETVEEQPIYTCAPGYDVVCPETCVSLEECDDCQCAVIDTGGGPWGSAMDVILCLFPIMFLLVVTLKPNPMATTVSLPLAAFMMFLIRLMYLGSDPLLACAAIISGVHEALSPISIMAGAILLFETMEATLCMPYMMREMKALTQGHALSELMLLFAFAYMVEGASGFGTPTALGAPMLVSLGYDKLEAVVTLLLMNTFATVWGAAGTPIWFGFGNLGISEDDFLDISYKSGIALFFASFLLLPLVLLNATKWQRVKENAIFFLLSTTCTVGPSLALSFVAYEFPALIGGMIGCLLTALLISYRVGIRPEPKDEGDDDDDGVERNHMDLTGSANPTFSIIESYKEAKVAALKVSFEGPQGKTEDTTATGSFVKSDEEEEEKKNDAKAYDEPQEAVTAVAASKNEDVEVEAPVEFSKEDGANADVNAKDPFANADQSSFDHGDQEDDNIRDSARAIEKYLGPRKTGWAYIRETTGRTFPLWGTVVLLVITRIPQLGLRTILNKQDPAIVINFQSYGIFRCSASLVLQLKNILTYPNINWTYQLLYVPFVLPFALVSATTMVIYRKDLQVRPRQICRVVLGRIVDPAIALFGALVLVQLLILGGEAAPATLIGTTLSEAFKEGWIAVAALVGALGSFFSGSTTISNLTFGEIQLIAAETIGISPTSMLALQACGGSAGNGICLNNIIAACTVVGLKIGEGEVIGRTWKIVAGSCLIATLSTLAFFIRFN